MAPLSAQLQDMQQNLAQLGQTTDAAMDLGLTNQETSRQLQKSCDWATEKILFLENQLKMDNLNLCGFPEGSEENTDLRIFISNWLASQWQLEEGVAPVLTDAYRLGPFSYAHSTSATPIQFLELSFLMYFKVFVYLQPLLLDSSCGSPISELVYFLPQSVPRFFEKHLTSVSDAFF